jgi:hypothetical protein
MEASQAAMSSGVAGAAAGSAGAAAAFARCGAGACDGGGVPEQATRIAVARQSRGRMRFMAMEHSDGCGGSANNAMVDR